MDIDRFREIARAMKFADAEPYDNLGEKTHIHLQAQERAAGGLKPGGDLDDCTRCGGVQTIVVDPNPRDWPRRGGHCLLCNEVMAYPLRTTRLARLPKAFVTNLLSSHDEEQLQAAMEGLE